MKSFKIFTELSEKPEIIRVGLESSGNPLELITICEFAVDSLNKIFPEIEFLVCSLNFIGVFEDKHLLL